MAIITGNNNSNVLNGTNQADELYGLDGNDTLSGGGGADKLVGGAGADTLTGGAAADTFVYTSAADSTAAALDIITDFSSADRIDLTAIAAGALTWSGTAASAYGVWYTQSGGNTYVSADSNGDGLEDFRLQLNGTIALAATHFIGINQAPDIRRASGDTIARTVAETNAGLTSTGTLTVTDPDSAQTVTVGVVATAISGTPEAAALIQAAASGWMSVTAGALAADAADQNNVTWTFNSGSEAFNFLKNGQTLQITYTIGVTDSNLPGAGRDTQAVTITINGTNDVPQIVVDAGDSTGASLSEGLAGLSAAGTLGIVDVDQFDTHTASVTGVVATGPTGGLSTTTLRGYLAVAVQPEASAPQTTASLGWSFNSGAQAFDFLGDGQTLTLDYTVRVVDSGNANATRVVSIVIQGENDAAVLAGSATRAYTENSAAVSIYNNGTLTLTDVDDTVFPSALVSITGAFHADQDVLSFTNTSATIYGDIQASYDAVTGVLSLASAGAATRTQWQSALRNVRYQNTSDNPDTASRTISFQINDGGATNSQSNVVTSTVTITAVNDAPIINIDAGDSAAAALQEGNAGLVGSGTLSVVDPDQIGSFAANVQSVSTSMATPGINNATLLSFLSVALGPESPPSPTTASLGWSFNSGAQAFDFLGDGQALTLNYTVRVTDAAGAISSRVVSIVIQGENDAAVLAGSTTRAYTENAAAVSIYNNGTLTLTDVDDTVFPSALVSITGNFHGGQDVLSFTNTSVTTYGDIQASYDAVTGVLSLASAGAATRTQWQNALRNVRYQNTSDNPDTASRTISFQINDGGATNSQSNVVTSTVTITAVNDAPVIAAPVTLAPMRDDASPRLITQAQLLANATDVDGPSLAAQNLQISSGLGTLVNNNDGTWTYTRAVGDTSQVSFSYVVSDGSLTAAATASLDILPNNAPQAAAVNVAAAEDTPLLGSLPVASDADGDAVTYSLAAPAINGTAVVNADGSYSYTPAANYNGSDTFSYTISDGHGGSSTYAVSVTVAPAQDAAVIAGAAAGSVTEDAVSAATSGALLITDIDGAADEAFQPQTGTSGVYGIFSVDAAGAWTYNLDNSRPAVQTLDGGETATDTFAVLSVDGTVKNVIITVNGDTDVTGRVTDGPIAGATIYLDLNGNGVADTGETAVATTDASGNFDFDTALHPSSFQLLAMGGVDTATGEANGLALTAPAGYSYINPLTTLVQSIAAANGGGAAAVAAAEALVLAAFNLDPGLNLADTDIYASNFAAEQAAATAGTAAAIIQEHGSVGAGADPFAALAAQVGGASAGGGDAALEAAVGNAAPAELVAFQQTALAIGNATTLTGIQDALNQNYFNDAPVLAGAPIADQIANEAQAFALTVPAGMFTDPEGAALTYSATQADGSSLPSWLSFNSSTRAFSGNVPVGSQDIDVRVIATDGGGLSVEDTFHVLTNGAPVSFDHDGSVFSNATIEGELDGVDDDDGDPIPLVVDPEGDTYHFELATAPVHGTATISPGGHVAYTPDPSHEGPDSFQYSVVDVYGARNTYTIALNVVSVNVAPQLTPVSNGGTGVHVVAVSQLPGSSNDDNATSVVQLADGRLVLTGVEFVSGGASGSLIRLNPDLTPDTSFGGGDGIVDTLPVPTLPRGANNRVVVQADGRMVVATQGADVGSTNSNDLTLVRYNQDGTLDLTFGGNGTGYVRLAHAGNDVNALLAVDPSTGDIIVAGSAAAVAASGSNPALPARILLTRYSADGVLDTTFGNTGTNITGTQQNIYLEARYSANSGIVETWAAASASLNEIIVQSDGNIVLVGTSTWGSGNNDFLSMRFHADGTIDSDYGEGGLIRNNFAPASGAMVNVARGVVQQSDGRLVVVGYTNANGNLDVVVARYNADGHRDGDFGNDGRIVFSQLTTNIDSGISVIQQTDGKILIVGAMGTLSTGLNLGNYDPDVVLIRLLEDGTLDTSFGGGDGIVTYSRPGGVSADVGFDVLQQADGRIVVVGHTGTGVFTGATGDTLVLRFNPDGSLDQSVGDPGVPNQVVNGGQEFSYVVPVNMFMDPDGDTLTYTAVLADGASLPSWLSFDVVTRTFSGTPPAGSADVVVRVIASDGRLSASDTFQLRINDAPYLGSGGDDSDPSVGILDGDGGVVTTSIGPGQNADGANYAVLQPDGRILVVGYATMAGTPSGTNQAMAVVRYNYDGTLDTTFGAGGKVVLDVAPGNNPDAANSVVVLPNGQILVAGVALMGSTASGGIADRNTVLLRLNANGSVDSSFGTGGDGIVNAAIAPGTGDDVAFSILVRPDGRIVLAGYAVTSGNGQDFALAGFNANGTMDTSFGVGGTGIVTTAVSTLNDFALRASLQADGRIVVVGVTATSASGASDIALLRYNADGSPDLAFSGDGMVITSLAANVANAIEHGRQVAVLSDGSILVGGITVASGGGVDFVLLRYTPTGELDSTFGSSGAGYTIMPIAPGAGADFGFDMAVLPSGQILMCGSSTLSSTGSDFSMVRFNANGSVDTTFDSDGIVIRPIGQGTASDTAFRMLVQPNGQIVLVGTAVTPLGGQDIALARFSADGADDDGLFGTTLVVNENAPLQFSIPNGLFVDPEGGALTYTATLANGNALPGWLTFVGREFAGTPPVGAGDLQIRVTATDPLGLSAILNLTIHVNHLPVATPVAGSTNEDTAISNASLPAATTLDADRDLISFTLATGAAHGTAAVNANGTYNYAPNANFNGTDSFTYQAADYWGATSTNTVTVTVAPVNDAPVPAGSPASVTVNAGVALSVTVPSGAFIDVDGDALTYGATLADGVTPLPAWLSFNPATREFTGTPPAGVADVVVRVTATDPSLASASQTLTFVVNDAPVVTNPPEDENAPDTSVGVLDSEAWGVTTPIGPAQNSDAGNYAVLQPDGKILVVGNGTLTGSSPGTTNLEMAVVRYNPDGTLDTTFGVGGKVLLHASPAGNNADNAQAVVVLPDGKILVAGTAFMENTGSGGAASNRDMVLIRLNSNGTLDTTFGASGTGIVNTPIAAGTGDDGAFSMVVQSTGRIVLGGFTTNASTGQDFALVGYNANGTLDTTFGSGGKTVTVIGSLNDNIQRIALQSDGSLVVTGTTVTTGTNLSDIVVARYTPMGVLDNSFSGDGTVTINFSAATSNALEQGRQVAVLSDGKILVGGYTVGAAGTNSDFALLRFNTDGSLDGTFGTSGSGYTITSVEGGPSTDFGYDLTVLPDGKILMCGSATFTGSGTDYALVRFNANGSLDTTFGEDLNGYVSDFLGEGTSAEAAFRVLVQPNGEILLVGTAFTQLGGNDILLLRFDANGVKELFWPQLTVNDAAYFQFTVPQGVFVDPEGAALTYTAILGDGSPLPAWMTFDANSQTVSGTPPLGNGDVSIRLIATDPLGLSVNLPITLHVNHAPPVTNVTLNMNENAVGLTPYPADVDRDLLTFVVNAAPQHGNVVFASAAGNFVTYSPNPNYSGGDTFTYTTTDDFGASSTSTVTVNVAPTTSFSDLKFESTFQLTANANTQLPTAGQAIGTVHATGSLGDQTSVTWSLSGAGASALAINASTGVISATTNLAVGTTYSVTAQATGTGALAGVTRSESFDFIMGNTFNEVLPSAGPAATILAGDDILFGFTGNDDTIWGGPANDTLLGQDGNDVLRGGSGHDWMWGGAGSDRFVFTETGVDVIADFQSGVDKVDLSGLTSYHWADFNDLATHFAADGGDLIINLDGANSIRLVGVTAIVAGDVLLP